MTAPIETPTLDGTLPLGTTVRVDIDGTPTYVQVCAVDVRRGYRVSNRLWGGRVDRWLPLADLTATRPDSTRRI